jgi:hypothetical protein
LNELSKIAFADIRKIVRPKRPPQAVLDWRPISYATWRSSARRPGVILVERWVHKAGKAGGTGVEPLPESRKPALVNKGRKVSVRLACAGCRAVELVAIGYAPRMAEADARSTIAKMLAEESLA